MEAKILFHEQSRAAAPQSLWCSVQLPVQSPPVCSEGPAGSDDGLGQEVVDGEGEDMHAVPSQPCRVGGVRQ
ncbi:Protein priB [Frankliniella fusca]|uniref:Protein priB n=1 Tax=Frankliniella fusca TaxID=407009 RepID=A0AAE1L7E3_9NEOP|nr:Protein priB [Frankliniella fusca]